MIEPIVEMPDGTLGYRVTDALTDADYADVLAPALRAAAAAGEVRLLLLATKGFDLGTLRSRFEEMRGDPELDLGHSKDWKRVAIVAEANFILRTAFPAVAKVLPVETRLFGLDDESEARSWIVG
ncbi:MAG TPA: STAS/SEC14 domain-containing protein [Solirubrobacterales bacterium]|nr:STAS/SEC14 domain-containing protein [Solirubrobacterales bacterium]